MVCFIKGAKYRCGRSGNMSVVNYAIQSIVTVIQIFLGSASIYSLLNDAIVVGLSFMFALYLIGFLKSRVV